MTTKLESYLQEVKERAEKATPGAWLHEKHKDDYVFPPASCGEDHPPVCDVSNSNSRDADFIAHSRTDIPKLLAMLEEALEAIRFYANKNAWNKNELKVSKAQLSRDWSAPLKDLPPTLVADAALDNIEELAK